MPDTRTEGGSVAADISRGAVHLLREHTGRGPTKARTVIGEDTIAIILGDTLTKGERSFVAKGKRQHVLHTRDILQQLMRDEWVQLVERLSGRTVEAFFSDDHIDADYALEFFLLDPLPSLESTDGSSEAQQGAG
jgi:uncharacterized protein YbcI